MSARKFLVPIDLGKLELQNAAVQNLGSAPASPVKGQIYYDTAANILYWWDGTTWQSAKAGGALTYGTITAETTFGGAKADGVATTVARSDHGHGNPTHVDADHVAIHLSALASPTIDLALAGVKITNLGTPLNNTDAATKAYVDNAISGLSWKAPVRVATSAAGTLATSFANGQTIDGIVLATNDRILIKNQAVGGENGIYTVNAAGAPTRATDNDAAAEFNNAACYVSVGTVNPDTAWVCTTDQPITVGTTPTVWVQFTGLGQITAGSGLTQTGNTINAIGGTGMDVQADVINVSRVSGNGRVPLLYAATFTGDGSSTLATVVHGLNIPSQDIIVQVYDMAAFSQVEADITITNPNTVQVNFAIAPANAKTYRIVCLG